MKKEMATQEKPMVVAIGEILWDVFPEERKIGGAPANFVYYASRLGGKAALISRIGMDFLGIEALAICHTTGLTTDFIQKDEIHPTGKVRVELDKKGVPVFEIEKDAAWDFLAEEEALFSLVGKSEVVYFGTLAQRQPESRKTIRGLLGSADCLKVLDLNLRFPHFDKEVVETSLEIADILKLNSDELKIVSRQFSLQGTESEILNALLQKYSLRLVALTLGSEGGRILSREQESYHPGYMVSVVDTVGAGDAFAAALIQGILADMDLDKVNGFANKVASFVCTKKGAWVDISDLIRPAW
jgi:fructokinase